MESCCFKPFKTLQSALIWKRLSTHAHTLCTCARGNTHAVTSEGSPSKLNIAGLITPSNPRDTQSLHEVYIMSLPIFAVNDRTCVCVCSLQCCLRATATTLPSTFFKTKAKMPNLKAVILKHNMTMQFFYFLSEQWTACCLGSIRSQKVGTYRGAVQVFGSNKHTQPAGKRATSACFNLQPWADFMSCT